MILIGLGASLPFCGRSPQENIARAANALHRLGEVTDRSRLYVSPAWPDPTDPAFVNAVIALRTGLGPEPLLAALNAIEAAFGRRRTKKYGPRTLDLDLLDYDGLIRTGEEGEGALILPHPGIAMREFVLRPLSDVEPEWRHPLTGESAESLLAKVEKPEVIPIDAGWEAPAA
ncbi:MAG TPA: 2-amino-4-hydroxy-6-hydroxymethyldihydropteridine diphosphokinase [Parvularculaceae bacterium]|nr:2-amino-4-hydroxy-6-hydroxymethyldihydropteridine diphosphokinase [Parvularculaceae bacterium]